MSASSVYNLYVHKGRTQPMAEHEMLELDEMLVKLRYWLRTAPQGASFDLTITKDAA